CDLVRSGFEIGMDGDRGEHSEFLDLDDRDDELAIVGRDHGERAPVRRGSVGFKRPRLISRKRVGRVQQRGQNVARSDVPLRHAHVQSMLAEPNSVSTRHPDRMARRDVALVAAMRPFVASPPSETS
ncbi:MAG TPA: hypothetical protein VGT98_02125, partial [Candidatus Elarobacter sp.]|nr:hypothetical protein [Candidatus Elarobacter sp.]